MKRFLTGVFHTSEIDEFNQRDGAAKLQYLASRWALKEALVKASGQTKLSYPDIFLHKFPPKEEEITLSNGDKITKKIKLKPQLMVSGEVNKRLIFEDLGVLAEGGMHASISHEDNYAVATVILEKYIEIPVDLL